MSSSTTGSKWIIIIMIYFIFMTLIVTVMSQFSGGEIESDYNTEQQYCSSPRALYEPYNKNIVDYSSDYKVLYGQKESHLDCSQSIGVLNNQTCLTINGCNWESPSLSFWENIWSWLGGNVETNPPTCLGEIDSSSYDIDNFNYLWGGNLVAEHNNTPYNWGGDGMGSICDHPNVINNKNLCSLFSCSWQQSNTINNQIDEFEINPESSSRGIISQAWSTIWNMFTFKQDFGVTSEYGNHLINLFLFWIPFVILLFAILQIIMQSTWT